MMTVKAAEQFTSATESDKVLIASLAKNVTSWLEGVSIASFGSFEAFHSWIQDFKDEGAAVPGDRTENLLQLTYEAMLLDLSPYSHDQFNSAIKTLLGEQAVANYVMSKWTPSQFCREVAELAFIGALNKLDYEALEIIRWVAKNLWKGTGTTGLINPPD
jgi:hypothetical protein